MLYSPHILIYKRHATGKTKSRDSGRKEVEEEEKEGRKLRKRNTKTVNFKTGSRWAD